MGRIFIGKGLHWALIAAVVGILWLMGWDSLQTRDFHLFLSILGLVAVAAVGMLIATSRADERITREPFE